MEGCYLNANVDKVEQSAQINKYEDRFYVQVSDFAVVKFLKALRNTNGVVNITVSKEDDSLLVAYDLERYKV